MGEDATQATSVTTRFTQLFLVFGKYFLMLSLHRDELADDDLQDDDGSSCYQVSKYFMVL